MNFKFLMLCFVICGSSLAYGQNTFPNTGAAGIGTQSPDAPLQIFVGPDSKPAGVVSASKTALKLSRFGTGNYSYNESADFRIAHGGPSYWGSRLDLYLNGASNQSNVPDQHVMTWQYNGNVGIGTADPGAKLDVVGTVKFGGQDANLDMNGNPIAYQSLAGTGKMLMGWNRTAGHGETDFVANEGGGSQGGFAFYSYNNASQEKQLLRIMGNGNVGIGTTNPTDMLTVAGKIGAREIKVSTGAGADFVFETDYKLPELAELEKFVKMNKHLPEIPTAKEMVENGVNLGELNIKLLQKVEELTLHLIEKEKQLQKQESKVNDLTSKLKQQGETIQKILKKLK